METILLRVKSHRARHKLKKSGIEFKELFNFGEGHFYRINASDLESALKIKSISKAGKPKGELMECWKTSISPA